MWLSDDLCRVHCCSNLLLHVSITIIRLTCKSKPKKLGAVFNLMGQVVWLLPQRRRLGSNMPTLVQPMSLTPWPSRRTSGAVSPRSKSFLRELGRQMRKETGEANSTSYLLGRGCCLLLFSTEGNSAAILGCANTR